MSSYTLRLTLVSLLFFFIVFNSYSYVYIYEVATKEKRYQTASKMSYNTFLLYNGGRDIIKSLKLIKTYADKDYERAVKEFRLEGSNYNELLPEKFEDNPVNIKPFIWWR